MAHHPALSSFSLTNIHQLNPHSTTTLHRRPFHHCLSPQSAPNPSPVHSIPPTHPPSIAHHIHPSAAQPPTDQPCNRQVEHITSYRHRHHIVPANSITIHSVSSKTGHVLVGRATNPSEGNDCEPCKRAGETIEASLPLSQGIAAVGYSRIPIQ